MIISKYYDTGAQAIANGVAVPGFSASLGYFDTYRRATVPANLVQVSLTYPAVHWGHVS